MAKNGSDDTISNRSVQSSHQDAHSYYSSVQEQGLARRNESPILYSRNFTNWIKSMLIRMFTTFSFNEFSGSHVIVISEEYVQLLKVENSNRKNDLCVFDMGCGKGFTPRFVNLMSFERFLMKCLGGDIPKWIKSYVKSVVFAGSSLNVGKKLSMSFSFLLKMSQKI